MQAIAFIDARDAGAVRACMDFHRARLDIDFSEEQLRMATLAMCNLDAHASACAAAGAPLARVAVLCDADGRNSSACQAASRMLQASGVQVCVKLARLDWQACMEYG